MVLRRLNKRGSEKYYILISLILGLLILGISLYFIFQEYFDENSRNWEVCRQSVVLRDAAIVKAGEAGGKIGQDIAESSPFKCRAELIEVDYKDYDKAGFAIVDAMAGCKALYNKDNEILYAPDWDIDGDFSCFQCARIKFSEDVRSYYSPEEYKKPSEKLQKMYEDLKIKDAELQEAKMNVEISPEQLEFQINNSKDLVTQLQNELLSINKEEEPEHYAEVEKEIADEQKKIDDWEGELLRIETVFENLKILVMEVKSLESEYYNEANKEINYEYFHWNKYLLKKMKNSDLTYSQYLYGKNIDYLVSGFSSRENLLGTKWLDIHYAPYFDARDGDLYINFIYKHGEAINWFGTASKKTVVPIQPFQELKCDIWETIPA